MANKTVQTLPTWAIANTDSNHYNVPVSNRWFRQTGNNYSTPGTFTPTIGSSAEFRKENMSSSQLVEAMQYGVTDPFWTDRDGRNNERGFTVYRRNTTIRLSFNIEINGGAGMWMPCSLLYSISFRWRNSWSTDANWAPRYVGLRVKNALTGQEKTWGSGNYIAPVYENIDKIYRIYNKNEFYELRDLGPEWFIYGLIFNMRTDKTDLYVNSMGKLTDCRLGYQVPGTDSKQRMVCPREMNWRDFSDLYKEGLHYYQ